MVVIGKNRGKEMTKKTWTLQEILKILDKLDKYTGASDYELGIHEGIVKVRKRFNHSSTPPK